LAGVAVAAGGAVGGGIVAGGGEVEGDAELEALADDLGFGAMDEGCVDLEVVAFGAGVPRPSIETTRYPMSAIMRWNIE